MISREINDGQDANAYAECIVIRIPFMDKIKFTLNSRFTEKSRVKH